jgi:predicted Zn-dependent peptidase
MESLLSGAFNSRVTTNIREAKGYTYSPGSGTTFNAGEALWSLNADVTTDVTGPALKEIFYEIRRLQTEAPATAEAAGIQTYRTGTFVLANASAEGLIGTLATRDLHGLPANWLESYIPSVLAITPAQIQAAAREGIPLEKMTLVVVGDIAKITPQLKALPELKGAKFETVRPFG